MLPNTVGLTKIVGALVVGVPGTNVRVLFPLTGLSTLPPVGFQPGAPQLIAMFHGWSRRSPYSWLNVLLHRTRDVLNE
jgi:hypothetical protein